MILEKENGARLWLEMPEYQPFVRSSETFSGGGRSTRQQGWT